MAEHDTSSSTAVEDVERIERDRRLILNAKKRGAAAKLAAYTRLSGPGWLQSAITLGGGSLAGGLYLGVLAGFSLMWLQPLAMILGVVMLSAIGYVALSTKERPFRAINRHVNPVLGWGWAVATLMANLVWCMPQFSLGTAAVQQNLLPDLLSDEAMGHPLSGRIVVVAALFLAATVVVWFYDSGGWGIKLFEILLKCMVALIVVCFFAVVIKMAGSTDGLAWGEILRGFVPDFRMLVEPAAAFQDEIARSGAPEFWWEHIVTEQRKVMITAAATAVGINMTFLLPYSMLARGWDRDFRGLAIFDLATGLFVPFMLATSCVVIASATRFHGQLPPGFVAESGEIRSMLYHSEPAGLFGEWQTGNEFRLAGGEKLTIDRTLHGKYLQLLDDRLAEQVGREALEELKVRQRETDELVREELERISRPGDGESADERAEISSRALAGPLVAARRELPQADHRLAAMLVRRDAFNLANSLERLTGRGTAQYVFGIGVVGMAVSTIIILMLINGFVVCEMLGVPPKGTPHRLGALLAACTGAAGPFLYTGEAKFWLAVPTSMFGFVLLPIAYLTFFLMMNSGKLMGGAMPRGRRRVRWNVLMGLALAVACFGSFGSIYTSDYPIVGFTAMGAFIVLAAVVHVAKRKRTR